MPRMVPQGRTVSRTGSLAWGLAGRGATQGVALDASLRTAAPLLGAGLDRIVHASRTEGLEPLALAARAEVALQLVDSETGLATVDLLKPPH